MAKSHVVQCQDIVLQVLVYTYPHPTQLSAFCLQSLATPVFGWLYGSIITCKRVGYDYSSMLNCQQLIRQTAFGVRALTSNNITHEIYIYIYLIHHALISVKPCLQADPWVFGGWTSVTASKIVVNWPCCPNHWILRTDYTDQWSICGDVWSPTTQITMSVYTVHIVAASCFLNRWLTFQ